MIASLQTTPYALERGEGQPVQLGGAQALVKATLKFWKEEETQ